MYPLKSLNVFQRLLTHHMLSIRIRQLEELNDPTDRIQGDYVTAGNSNYMTIHAKDYINDHPCQGLHQRGSESNTILVHTLSLSRERPKVGDFLNKINGDQA